MNALCFRIRLQTKTSQNMRFINPFARAAIVKRERKATAQAFIANRGEFQGLQPNQQYAVKLVRIGPNELDDDNLEGSLKAVRDEIAAQLGVDDGRGDRRVRWIPDQRSEGHVTFKDPKTGKRKRTGVFAVEVLIRPQRCDDCWVEHCKCIHDAQSCADCEGAE